MESLKNCDVIMHIELIELISGGNQEFEVLFLTKDQEKYKLVFDFVWDMRYSIENASIERFCRFRERLPEGIIDNGIYRVEDSEYIKYFEKQVDGTMPINELKHYIISDGTDTILDVLTTKEPKLVGIDTQGDGSPV